MTGTHPGKSGPGKQALHPHRRHRDQFLGAAVFRARHADAQQLHRGTHGKLLQQRGRVFTEIDRRESRQLPHLGTARRRLAIQQGRKDAFQQIGARGRQQPCATDDVLDLTQSDLMLRVAAIELVEFMPRFAGQVPLQALDEYLVAIATKIGNSDRLQCLPIAKKHPHAPLLQNMLGGY